MPHIIIEYSKALGEAIEVTRLVRKMHNTLAAQGIDRERIKTWAHACDCCIVGNPNTPGHMVHATLLLLEGRDVATKQQYGEALFSELKSIVDGAVGKCAVSLEIRDMSKDTYYQ